ncbi:MAG: hypothetical protein IPF57_25250 [Gammaproteobacteria bacterium]|jgi:hypothetical protein|nr:hypothetical protein [Gammaproteobacteria bacterium]MBK8990189.1 hypothetical protein [Gammaproteobacteria bacterium]MBK9469253.1 hypothetical protein [Gammaproteobacteria bacterium]MBP6543044.1 hypothetical protein [Piscinibacter sp.]
MSRRRKNDRGTAAFYQSDRVLENNGKWYFQTREEGLKGPFPDRQAAQDMLQAYIKTMDSPFRPSSELGLMPLDP